MRRLALLVAVALLPQAAGTQPSGLPADVANHLRRQFGDDARYVDGAADLNGDGRPETVVYVVGPMACGSGGCPTLVFTPDGYGYRLVSSITVTNPPIKASAATTAGWRNLIVRVSGGGAKAHDAELLSNGKSYPPNPSVAGPRVKTAAAGGEVIIKEFQSFDDTRPLPPKGGATPSAPAAAASAPGDRVGPSFECGKATAAVEKLVCGDASLSTLDRNLAATYTKFLSGDLAESDRAAEQTAQRSWIAARNACEQTQDVRACVESSYQRRLVEVRIKSGALLAPTPVGYRCTGQAGQPFTAAFYSQTEPPSVVLTWGNRQIVAFSAPSGSGSRYTAPGVEFWEHQGEASVKWAGSSFTCTPAK
jgi:uncharacterized protein